MMMVEK